MLDKLTRRLNILLEDLNSPIGGFKNPNNPEYDRQYAEDALYHTIGPLTNNPTWANEWTSKSAPPPEFSPGGPAPQWTPDELVLAYAGDPSMLMSDTKDNPKSPKYGSMGGSPLYRAAWRTAKKFNRRDPQFVADLYSNGFIPLVQMMKPGYDESRGSFIPYVTRTVLGAMEGGVGGTERHVRAMAGDSKSGTRGIQALLSAKTGDQAREIANQVKGEFQQQSRHDKHADNPFGPYSNEFHKAAMDYADALDSRDSAMVQAAASKIEALNQKIEDSTTLIPGAATGLGQAITVSDRKTKMGLSSLDKTVPGSESDATMAANISTDEHEAGSDWMSPEAIHYILNIGLTQDMAGMVGDMAEFQAIAKSMGAADGKIGGKLTVNELRYIIRYLGPLGSNYPGLGVPRANVQVPRDAIGWWKPGEDPEIEPGTEWKSIWTRKGYPTMGPTEIAKEMTDELYEFKELGIPSARLDKVAAGKTSAVSKVAVSNTSKVAMIKLRVIAAVYKEELGLDESKKHRRAMLESVDIADRLVIAEGCEFIARKIRDGMVKNWL